MGGHGRRRRQQVFQHADIARSRGHADPRVLPQPQGELQLVPRLFGLLPLGQLIHPGRVKLRPAQPLWVMRRMHRRHGPIGPDQPLARRLPIRSPVRGRARQYPAVAKDHHLAHLLDGLSHQRHTATAPRIQGPRPFDLRAHPFRPRARLARTAPAHDHPGPPVAVRGELMRHGPELEQKRESQKLSLLQIIQEPVLHRNIGGADPACTRCQPAPFPCPARIPLGQCPLVCFCTHSDRSPP